MIYIFLQTLWILEKKIENPIFSIIVFEIC